MMLFVVHVGYVIVLEVNHDLTMLLIVYEIYRDQTVYYSASRNSCLSNFPYKEYRGKFNV